MPCWRWPSHGPVGYRWSGRRRGLPQRSRDPCARSGPPIGRAVLINDAYNANPASARAALDLLDAVGGAGGTGNDGGERTARRQRVVVLGTMRELGPTAAHLHTDIARRVLQSSADIIAGIGEFGPALLEEGRADPRVLTAPDVAELGRARTSPRRRRGGSAESVARRPSGAARSATHGMGGVGEWEDGVMLYHLLAPMAHSIKLFNLFNYITFRAAGAFVTSLLVAFSLGPPIVRRLKAMAVNQVVRDGTPESHRRKQHTPTMGGIIVVLATLIPTLLWAKLNNTYVVVALVVMVWMGAIGFLDDYLKLRQLKRGEKNLGLVERYKLTGQIVIGVALGWYLWQYPISTLPGASTTLPFFKYVLVVPAAAWLAWIYVPFVTFVLTGVSNAVNLTDGLDGLAAGLTAIAALTFAVFAYVIGRVDSSTYLQIYYLRGAGDLRCFVCRLRCDVGLHVVQRAAR